MPISTTWGQTSPLRLESTLQGCLLITACSLIKIPAYPVSFTLHTMAVAYLGLTQNPRQAAASVLFYLGAAALGLPVLCGHSNPLWFAGKSAGYLAAFPLASFVIAHAVRHVRPWIACLIGQLLIYICGYAVLTMYLNPVEALQKGVLVFIPSDVLKSLAAISLARMGRPLS